MAATYPGTLPATFDISGWQGKDLDQILRTDMAVGEAIVRRRYTKNIETMRGSYLLTTAQYTTFQTFFRTTCNAGATTFDWTHPITSDAIECRFVGVPSFSAEGKYHRASFQVEIIG